MFYVYVLYSTMQKKFYTGATSNLAERLRAHRWHTVKTTKSSSYKLVWCGVFPDKKKAFEFERYLKTGSGMAFRNRHLV